MASWAHLERVDHLRLGQLVGRGLDHAERLVVAGDHQVELGVVPALEVAGEQHQLAVQLADADRAQGALEGDLADVQRREGGDHREDVGAVVPVVAEHLAHHLDLLTEALGEQRPDRTVDQPHGQDLLGRRTPFALEEAPGDLPGGVGLLAVVDGQGEEVEVFPAGTGAGGGEDLGLAVGDDAGPVGLAGDLTGLDGQRLARDLTRHAGGFPAHSFLSAFRGPFSGPLSLSSTFLANVRCRRAPPLRRGASSFEPAGCPRAGRGGGDGSGDAP